MYNIPQEMIDEFNKEMKVRSEYKSVKFAHESMDALMCEILEKLGFGDGVWTFMQTYKWYS
nr:MAG TPA: hypothetical protein [Caudoviricetes sp.]